MIIHRIFESTNLAEIGTYPQAASQVEFNLELLHKPHINTFNPFEQIYEDFFFPVQQMTKTSKLTDLISFATNTAYGLFISYELAEIIKPYVSENAQLFPVQISKKDVLIDYLLLHFYKFSYHNLDYEKTIFFRLRGTSTREEKLLISNEKELKNAIDKYKYPEGIEISHVSFKENLSEHFFVLQHVYGGTGYYISETLKKKIEAAGCTGIKFLEANERP
jgi:hypothetical protein